MQQDLWRQALTRGLNDSAGFTFALPRRQVRGQAGYHLGQKQGSSLEYKDFRDYQPGDDLRHIDWSAYARSDRLTIKRFHEEVTPHVDVVLDNSRSMNLDASRKAQAALAFCAFLAGCALNSGFRCTPWLAGDSLTRLTGGGLPPSWQASWFDETRSPDLAFQHQPKFHGGGLRFLISDLMWQGDPTPILRNLARDAAGAAVLQVLAHRDLAPDHGGKWRLIDAESGVAHEVTLDRAQIDRYRDALQRHQNLWRDTARRFGVVFVAIDADVQWQDRKVPPELLRELLHVRSGT